MSVTPPPTYSPEHSQGQLKLDDLKQALPSTSATPSAIEEKTRLETKEPTLVNVFNYTGMTFGDGEEYEHADFLPSFPKVSYPPLGPIPFTDRGHFAAPDKSRLFAEVTAQGGKVKLLTPAIGAEFQGASLKKLSPEARDDLALFIAERGVVFFRDQSDLDIDSQLDLGRHWGPLHVHATTGVPRRPGLEEVHVVYADKGARPDPTAFSKPELYHSDVTYEVQPPGPTILKIITAPEVGGDTLFSSGSALYSSLSEPYQKYLESLSAVHSGHEQAKGARGAGTHVRREGIETVHPVVRVHPVTGVKSVFVNAGFTRRLVGVPKSESDNTLQYLNREFALNPDFSVRFKWELNDVAIWDNRVLNHSALFDFWPERRHAVRVTPQAEKPQSVEEYERETGKKAKDWLKERYAALGVDSKIVDKGINKGERGFKD